MLRFGITIYSFSLPCTVSNASKQGESSLFELVSRMPGAPGAPEGSTKAEPWRQPERHDQKKKYRPTEHDP